MNVKLLKSETKYTPVPFPSTGISMATVRRSRRNNFLFQAFWKCWRLVISWSEKAFYFIWEYFIQFFPQFHNRNLGLIATSIHLIKLLDRMPIKGEPLLTGKDVNFVKYIVCAVFFMWEVMWYDVTSLIHFFSYKLNCFWSCNMLIPFFLSNLMLWMVG